jgi:gamma-glutamylcyclotransferase (GGCT)/AIG2-like uncharacterized protein YtfP
MRCFVYGSLRPGDYNHERVGGSTDARPATTKGQLYDSGHGYPLAKLDEEGTIVGDVVYFGPEAWKDIVDMEEGAGYVMQEVTVTFTDDDSSATIPAWHYERDIEPDWQDPVSSGDWFDR